MAAPNGARPTLPIVVTAVWGVLLLPGLLGAALSVMFFDAPGSMTNPAAWTNASIVVSFPVLCLLSGTIGVLTSGQPLGLHSTIIKH
jgi:hypothetical protein